jgi:predicted PolB exonuclease-like 3'-5' exonuclease
MPEHSVIVWDLETIPDLAAAARMLDMTGKAETEVREALGPGFPKQPLHKIVCIGAWWRAANLTAGALMRSEHLTSASALRLS